MQLVRATRTSMSTVSHRVGALLSALALVSLGLGTIGASVLIGDAQAGATGPTNIGCADFPNASASDISDLTTALSSSGTVDLTAGCTYALTTVSGNPNPNNSALPSITGTNVVNGQGATITSSVVSADIFEVTLTGTLTVNDLTISDAQGGAGVDDQGSATINASTVSGNTGSGLVLFPNSGVPTSGGILNVNDSTISGNSGMQGGGIGSEEGGVVTITNSTITGNTGSGAAAIDNDGTSTMTIDDSTISGNTGDDGGGIQNNATLFVDDSTIADNTGSGLANGGVATIDDSTISGNTSTNGGAGINSYGTYFDPSDAVTLAGDIVATAAGAPVGGECQSFTAGIIDAGYNVDDDGTCGFSLSNDSASDSTTIDGDLGPLASNGGSTQTVSLVAGAPSNANPAQADIPSSFTAPGQVTTACSQADQRGTARATPCDMGAYALNVPAPYGVTYADGAGTGTPPSDPNSYGYFEAATVEQPIGLSDPGFTFAGWNTAADGSGTPYAPGDTLQVTGDATLTAQWYAAPFSVTYADGTGTGSPPTDSNAYPGGSMVTVAQPTELSKAGSVFAGWNTAADGSGTSYSPGTAFEINNDTVLTAQWSANTGPPPPPPPAGSTAFDSASGNSGAGTVMASVGCGSASGAGAGSITVAAYGSNPSGATVPGGTGVFYDASAGNGSTFTSVTITVCDPGSGQSLEWFDGTAWVPFSEQSAADGSLLVTVTNVTSPTLQELTGTPVAVSTDAPPVSNGYVLAASDGGVFRFGAGTLHGSTGGQLLDAPIVGEAATPGGEGYWLVASDGGVFGFGNASFYGSMGGKHLDAPIVGMAATPDGGGYWLVASDGGVFSFGDAGFFGSQGSTVLDKPIVGMAATPSGDGYWLVASDGGIFTHGDAGFFGSQGSTVLDKPIVGMAATPDGGGYWLVAGDGGVFTHGDAGFFGSEASHVLNRPVVGIESSPSGSGYWLVAGDGGVFSFGDGGFAGSLGSTVVTKPVVGIIP